MRSYDHRSLEKDKSGQIGVSPSQVAVDNKIDVSIANEVEKLAKSERERMWLEDQREPRKLRKIIV